MLPYGINLMLILGFLLLSSSSIHNLITITEASRTTARPYNQIYNAYYAHRNPLTPNSDSSSSEKSPATSGEVDSPSQRCSKGGKTRIEDFTNVNKFYMCTFNSAHHVWMVYSFNCPSETEFDKHSQKCSSKPVTTGATSANSAYSKFAQQIKSQLPTTTTSSSYSSSSGLTKIQQYQAAVAAAAAAAKLTSTTPTTISPTSHHVHAKPGQGALNQLQYMQAFLAQKNQALSQKPGVGGVNDNLRKTTLPSPYNRIRPSPNPHQYVRFPQRPTIATRPPYNYNYHKYFITSTPTPTTTTTATTTTTTTTTEPSTTTTSMTPNILQAIEKLTHFSSSSESGEGGDGDESPNNIGVIRMIASRIAYLAQAIESVLTSFDANSNFCDNDNVIVKLGSAEQLQREEEEEGEDEEYDEDKIHLHIQTPTSSTLSPPSSSSSSSSAAAAAAAGPSVPVHFNFLDYYNRIKNGSVNHSNLATTTTTSTTSSSSNFVEKLQLTTPPSSPSEEDGGSDDEMKSAEHAQVSPQSTLVDSSAAAAGGAGAGVVSTEKVVQAQTPETTTTTTTITTKQSLQDAAEWNIFLHNLSRLSAAATIATTTTENSIQMKESQVPQDSSKVVLTVADEDDEGGEGGDENVQENSSSSEEKVPTSPFKFSKFPSSSPTLANIQKIKELADSLKVRGNNRKPRSVYRRRS